MDDAVTRPESTASAATLVSVIIPCHNAEKFIEEAVASVWATGYQALDILIVEDGSEDRSPAIADRLAHSHPSVRVLRHDPPANRGAGYSRNAGAMAARGEYLAFLDADDYVFPNRFARAVEILDTRPDVDAVCGTTKRIVSEGGEWREHRIRDQTVFDCDDPDQVLERRLFGSLAWSTNAILLRKKTFMATGGFGLGSLAEDAVLWLKLACIARIVPLGRSPICVYRQHAANHSSLGQSSDAHRAINTWVVSEALLWARRNGVPKPKRQSLQRALLGRALNDNRRYRAFGQYNEALHHLVKLLRTHPSLLMKGAVVRGLALTVGERLGWVKPVFSSAPGDWM